MHKPQTIMVVDDDPDIRESLCAVLRQSGYQVIAADNPKEADKHLLQNLPDLIILDIMMPFEDGRSYCRRLVEKYAIPIIMISALQDEVEEIVAHELGALHYMRKPFNVRVLLAKVKNVLLSYQRVNVIQENVTTTCYRIDDLTFDPSMRLIIKGSESVKLNGSESKLLLMLVEASPNPVSTHEIMEKIYHKEATFDDRAVSTLIHRLRVKLKAFDKANLLQTAYGEGYLLAGRVSYEK